MSNPDRSRLSHDASIGVFYSNTNLGLDDYAPFEYTNVNIPTGKKYHAYVWCRNEAEFRKLIDSWNYQSAICPAGPMWVYYLTAPGWRR